MTDRVSSSLREIPASPFSGVQSKTSGRHKELRTVEDIGAFRDVTRTLVTGEGTPQPVLVAEMTAAGFSVARTPTLMGRYLVPEDEREGSPAVVVIGYDVWHDRFASAPDMIGRELRLGRVTHTVIGVMPEGFAFPMQHQYWVPLRENPLDFERREGPAIYIFGRLAPGIGLEEAQSELEYVSATGAACAVDGAGSLRCTLGSIAAGSQTDFTVLFRGAAAGLHTNTLTVTGLEPDPDAANNTVVYTQRVH